MKYKVIFDNILKKIVGEKHRDVQYFISSELVKWGYRLFLDREPENQAIIADKSRKSSNTWELRQEILKSEEFRQKNPDLHAPSLSGDEPRMPIEDVKSESDLQVLLKHIQDTWQYLGKTEPHWSVLTADQYKQSNMQNSKETFYNTGRHNVSQLFHAMDRNEIDYTSYQSCLEYGCGLGRVTRWLAERFGVVYGYDISQAHLQGAGDYLVSKQIGNVTLHHIKKVKDIMNLPQVDLIYSVIVLQHNPPPIISLIIREFIKSLNLGGVAFFQVPTYRIDYSFCLKSYLDNEATEQQIEMHVLPQREIFEIVRQEGAKVLEVLEDGWTGLRYKENSNTFLVKKG